MTRARAARTARCLGASYLSVRLYPDVHPGLLLLDLGAFIPDGKKCCLVPVAPPSRAWLRLKPVNDGLLKPQPTPSERGLSVRVHAGLHPNYPRN